MAEIDPTTLKPGDVVLARFVLDARQGEGSNWWLVSHATTGEKFRLHEDDIVSIEPRPLAVGERVLAPFNEERQPGRLLAIAGEDGWVEFDSVRHADGRPARVPRLLSELERIP